MPTHLKNNNYNTKLHSMLEQFNNTIESSRLWLDMWINIGDNSAQINQTEFSPAFAITQIASFNMLAIDVYCLFDKDDYNTVISMPHILRELNQGNYSLIDVGRYTKALQEKFGIKVYSNQDSFEKKALNKLSCKMPSLDNDSALQRIKNARHNFIAHKNFEKMSTTLNRALPSGMEVERLLDKAKDFRYVLREGYFPDLDDTFLYNPYDDVREALSKLIVSASNQT